MKKSNALMLSYMIFLGVALLANILFKWDELERIAIAATTAGCFFAFADLSNWYVSYQTPLIDALQKDSDTLLDFRNAALTSVQTQEKELTETIVLITPYKDDISAFEELSTCIQKLKKWNDDGLSIIKEVAQGHDEAESLLYKARKKLKAVNNIEITMMVLGFLIFFSLLSFDWILNLLIPFQSIATVLAFILIILTYFLRDVLEEKAKQKINEILEETKKAQEKTEEILKKATETPILDKVKELVKEIKKENADGKTKNAQPEQG